MCEGNLGGNYFKTMNMDFTRYWNQKNVKWLLVAWQFISVLMVSVGNWPVWLIWLNLALGAAYILFLPIIESLAYLVLSLPFYVGLPIFNLDSLATWRILFILLFAKWLYIHFWKNKLAFRTFAWDKWLGLFLAIAFFVTLAFGRFRLEGLKQIIFFLNAWLLYAVLVNTVKTKEEVLELARAGVICLTIAIVLGYTQLFSTFFSSMDVFWVYWASNISKLYYGSYFASVSLYSNSWFSFSSGGRDLRMFGIMPDSQSFAYLAAFGLGFGTALTYAVSNRLKSWLWSGIRFAGLAIMLSGTRAVWVGMLAPFLAICVSLYKNFLKPVAKKFFWAFVIVIILFIVSPLFNRGLAYLRFGGKFQENFVDRARSIYDLNETSNAGRIIIWKDSLSYATTHPWGTGLKNFIVSQTGNASESEQYLDLARRHNERYNLPQGYVSAHSLYLQLLVETGLAGLAAFLYFCFKVLSEFWHFLKRHRSENNFWVFFVFQAALVFVWILAAGVFDITLFNDKVLIFFFLSLGLSGAIVKNYDSWGKIDG